MNSRLYSLIRNPENFGVDFKYDEIYPEGQTKRKATQE